MAAVTSQVSMAPGSLTCVAASISSKAAASHVRLAARIPAASVSTSRRAASVVVRASATAVDLDELVASIKSLTLEQARTLTDRLQEELGVTAASFAAPAAAAPGAGPAEAAPAVEEKTEFDLLLDEVPASARIAVIKVVRALTGLGLKEAKDMIEGLPKKVKEAVAKEDAEDGKKQLEAAGAKCSIK